MLSKVDNSDLALITAVYSRLLAELTLHFDWRIVHEQHLGGAMSRSSARWSAFFCHADGDIENPRAPFMAVHDFEKIKQNLVAG